MKRLDIKSKAGVLLTFGERKILDLNHLYQAALEERAVHCPNAPAFQHRIPAAFIINLQGAVIHRLFNSGMYVYPRKDEIS